MNTALQTAIEKIRAKYPKEIKNERQDAYTAGLEEAVGILLGLLPTEKQQMEDAWNAKAKSVNVTALEQPINKIIIELATQSFNSYYTKTYNNEK